MIGAKMTTKRPHDAPKMPEMAQEGPKMAQETPKGHPNSCNNHKKTYGFLYAFDQRRISAATSKKGLAKIMLAAHPIDI